MPRGPYVYGTTQDNPSAGTVAWPVPGASGSNARNVVTRGGGTGVTVYTNVFDTSGDGLSSVNLYYYVDASRALTRAPDVATQYPNFSPPYATAIAMEKVAGNQYRTPTKIPINDNKNVWYFIVAVDDHGNFDREPEIDSGAFQYFQQPEDTCLTTPNPPATLGVGLGLDRRALVGSAHDERHPLRGGLHRPGRLQGLPRQRVGLDAHRCDGIFGSGDRRTTPTAARPQMESYTYRYYVSAYDACTPHRERERGLERLHRVGRERLRQHAVPAGDRRLRRCDLPGRVQLVLDGADDERAALGRPAHRPRRLPRSGARAGLRPLRPDRGPSRPPRSAFYTDTGITDIRSFPYSYFCTAYDSCTPRRRTRAYRSNIYTEPLVFNPCDETPNAPTLSGSAAADAVSLTWAPPTHNTNGEIFQDPGGYDIWRRQDGGAWAEDPDGRGRRRSTTPTRASPGTSAPRNTATRSP